MTNNKNRTAAEIRSTFSKYGGNLGETGSVSFGFIRLGSITLDKKLAQDPLQAGYEIGLQYDEMIIYGTLGMILFGAAAPLAGFLSDKYGRMPLMILYHFGIGISAILASLSTSTYQLAMCLALIGMFASIYHPVGIAMLLQRPGVVGLRMGINGVWGNMGIAVAPIVTGVLLYYGDWRLTFMVPGIICIIFGIKFFSFMINMPFIYFFLHLISSSKKFFIFWC